jgi:hypothetical protein
MDQGEVFNNVDVDIFYSHGEVILTDQGREFWNKVEYLHI